MVKHEQAHAALLSEHEKARAALETAHAEELSEHKEAHAGLVAGHEANTCMNAHKSLRTRECLRLTPALIHTEPVPRPEQFEKQEIKEVHDNILL